MRVVERLRAVWNGSLRLDISVRDVFSLTLLLGLATVLLFFRLGEGSLADYDEATYAQIAKEALRTNDWLTPHWNGVPIFDKPPLSMWLTALAYKVFGINEFAARFWSAAFGLGVVVITYAIGRMLFGWVAGLGGALLLLTVQNTPHSYGYNFVALSRQGMLDSTLIFWLCLAALLAWKGRERPRCWVWMGVPLGLALMTKSAAALVHYGIITLYLFLSQGPRLFRRAEFWAGLGVSALIGLPWYLYQLVIHGYEFFFRFVILHIFGYASGWQGHTETTPWFYLGVIRNGFPVSWLAMIPAAGYGLWQVIYKRGYQWLLLLCWVVVPLILFSAANTRIAWYIQPTYPALALLIAGLITRLFRGGWGILVIGILVAFGLRLPMVGDLSADVKRVAQEARCLAGPDGEYLIFWRDAPIPRPSALYYLDAARFAATEEDLVMQLPETAYIVTDVVSWDGMERWGNIVYRAGNELLVVPRRNGR
ncbi:MAG: glycosyltransferase family 39 protein [Chloroflexi bacterium]|nr:glycosyltransferase family 39 protein [Chloroflexota bacterium]